MEGAAHLQVVGSFLYHLVEFFLKGVETPTHLLQTFEQTHVLHLFDLFERVVEKIVQLTRAPRGAFDRCHLIQL